MSVINGVSKYSFIQQTPPAHHAEPDPGKWWEGSAGQQ